MAARVVAVADGYFDERVADRYDEMSADMFDPSVVDPAVSFLAELAGDGQALELGVGTGRIALPLSQRGITVEGIDRSVAMVARLCEKPGGDIIEVTIGDFATTVLDRTFRVVYLVFNTIMNLTSQDQQVACFSNAARHLEPGGCFVVEVDVPALQRLPPGETVRPFAVTPTYVGFDQYDIATQGLVSHHFRVVDGQLDVLSLPFRYVWQPNWTSWPDWQGWRYMSGGATGTATPSLATAPSTYRSG
jgi:SAM-dependent methyltransferase